jgi:hypothetical protein
MPSSSSIRIQVESALAHKIPSALTPPARIVRPFVATGISELDGLIQGGFPRRRRHGAGRRGVLWQNFRGALVPVTNHLGR